MFNSEKIVNKILGKEKRKLRQSRWTVVRLDQSSHPDYSFSAVSTDNPKKFIKDLNIDSIPEWFKINSFLAVEYGKYFYVFGQNIGPEELIKEVKKINEKYAYGEI